MTQGQLLAALQPRVTRNSRLLHTQVWAFLALQMATLLLAGANLLGYRSNPLMLGVECVIAVGALAFAAYGVRLFGEVRRLEQMDESLGTILRRRLVFYRMNASTWMWVTALSLASFTFALNSLIDNVDETYTINHPLVYAGLQLVMVLVVVMTLRLAYEPRLRELRATSSDLEAQVLDRTRDVEGDLARSRRTRLALALLLTAAMAIGLWMACRAGS